MKKDYEKLGVLISTYGDGLASVISTVLPTIDLRKAVVIINHQKSDLYDGTIPHGDSIVYHKSDSVGLSKSRNECLGLTPCEINIIADDDISYVEGFEETILHAFKEKSDADIITFQTVEDNPRTKKIKQHSWLSMMHVRSIEIAFRKSSIQSSGLVFDKQFGLGATYETGEESIFLQDARKSGLNIYDNPEKIVCHSHMTSGQNLTKEMMRSKRAMFIRMFGSIKGVAMYYAFCIRKM